MDTTSEAYQTLCACMIRLKAEDFERPAQLERVGTAAGLTEEAFVSRCAAVASRGP